MFDLVLEMLFGWFLLFLSEIGGDGGSKLVGCCMLLIIIVGVFKLNCWMVLLGFNVKRMVLGL